jgi:hypothetical protein
MHHTGHYGKFLLKCVSDTVKTHSDLQNTINSCMPEFERLFRSFNSIVRDNKINSILGNPPDFTDLDAFVAYIKELLTHIAAKSANFIKIPTNFG